MKNYYEELEINKNASKEVIEKVYKVLAKKYHPDITQEADKHAAEEKFKTISEAYEILSDDEKRKKYDLELEQSSPSVPYEDYLDIINQRDTLINSLNNFKKQFQNTNTSNTSSPNSSKHRTSTTVSNNINNSTNYNNTIKNKQKKVKYYNVATGKPVSAFTYYKYKIKQFISNIFFFIFAILAILLAINSFFNLNLSNILKI